MVYLNCKPVIVVCNNTAFVKKLNHMKDAGIGFPYKGANKHYILDIDNAKLSQKIIIEIEKVTPIPQKKKSRVKILD